MLTRNSLIFLLLLLQCCLCVVLSVASEDHTLLATRNSGDWSDIQDDLPSADPLLTTPNKYNLKLEHCAVVGQSGILTSTGLGSEIDKRDTIIRVNWAPTRGYEEDVGSKTHIAIVDAALAGADHDFDELSAQFGTNNKFVIVHAANSSNMFVRERDIYSVQLETENIFAVSQYFESFAAESVTFAQRLLGFGGIDCIRAPSNADLCKPSAGLVATILASVICEKSVTFYGFAGPAASAPILYYDTAASVRQALKSQLTADGLGNAMEEGFQERKIEFQIIARLRNAQKTKRIQQFKRDLRGVDTFPQISLTLPQRAASPHSIAAKQFEPDTAQQRAVDAEVKKQKQMAAYVNQTPRPVPTTTTPLFNGSARPTPRPQPTLPLVRPGLPPGVRHLGKLRNAVEKIRDLEHAVAKKYKLDRYQIKFLEEISSEVLDRTYDWSTAPERKYSPELHQNGFDEPPLEHANLLPLPVNPADYADAAIRSRDEMLRQATNSRERNDATNSVKDFKMDYSDNKYIKVAKLGSGTYGTAYLCEPDTDANNVYADWVQRDFIDQGTPLVLKVLKSGHKASLLPKEVLVLKRLKGIPYALQLLDVVRIGRTHTGLVFPYTNNTYYRDAFPLLSAQDVREYTRRVLIALDGAHSRGIVHMDIKPINIFYDFYSGDLQLGDWGLAFFYNNRTHHSWQTMTLYWKAPEVAFGARDYSYAVDMWSVGVTFAGMLTGKFHFFEGKDVYQLASSWIDFLGVDMFEEFIERYRFQLKSSWVRKYVHRRPAAQWTSLMRDQNRHMITAEALDLASKMLQIDPAKRISARDALKHPYFTAHQSVHLDPLELQDRAKSVEEFQKNVRVGAVTPPDPYEAWSGQVRKHGKPIVYLNRTKADDHSTEEKKKKHKH